VGIVLVALLGGVVGLLVVLRHQPTAPPTTGIVLDPTADWRTYTSPKWGYSIKYPPTWFDVPNRGAPDSDKYFANRDVGAPLQMDSDGVFLGIQVSLRSGTKCSAAPYIQGDAGAGQKELIIDGVTASRYTTSQKGTGPVFTILDLERPPLCYELRFVSYSIATRDSNLPTEELILSSFKFGKPNP